MAVYTLDNVERIFGVTYTPEQRASLTSMPFSEDVLDACVGTHMLFPGFPLSLLDVRATFADLFYSKRGGWYAGQTFAKDVQVRPLWHLLRMEPVAGSLGKSWKEQCKLLLPDEEVPSAATVAFATMLRFKATGQRLFGRCYVRTSDVDSDGDRADIGRFGADGFDVSYHWDTDRYGALGLSASRKF
jgi:hypothetical protein